MCDYSHYDELLSRYLDGVASEQDMASLEERLLAEPQFADYVSEWCLMHRHVFELHQESQLHQLMDQFATGAPSLPKRVFSPLRAEGRGASAAAETAAADLRVAASAGGRPAIPSYYAASLAAAAMLLIAMGGYVLSLRSDQAPVAVHQPPGAPAPAISRPPEPAGEKPIATVTRLVDAVWKPGAERYQYGDSLMVGGRVALESGLAKVTYECGAEVVLEGPCEFLLNGKMVGTLKSGRITADVPRRAFAFAILAPGVDFVDLGTSFGLNVSEAGDTELHVFDGEVLCNQTGDVPAGEANGELIHVTADRAMGFRPGVDRPDDIAIDRRQFSQLIALRKDVDFQPQHWTSDQLALWLAADAAVSTDDQRRVIAWGDILYADNQSAEDAMQPEENARPLLVKHGVNGRPSIRFDGTSDFLLTTPLQTSDDQTVMFVCQFSPSAFSQDRRWGGQIINYDGPPSRYLSDTLEPGVLQIGEPLLESQFKPSLLSGQVFAGFIGSTTVEAGRVDGVPVGPETPIVVSYVYDYGKGRAELRVNGRSAGVARAFAPQAITSRKIIGRHAWMHNYFHGDLAELLIYNKALSPDELDEATAYLAEKYEISLGAQ